MQPQKTTGKGFRPQVPLQELERARKDGRLSDSGHRILIWLWGEAEPDTGIAHPSYRLIAHGSPVKTSEQNARKIMSDLRKERFVYFPNHRGKGGSFPAHIIEYYRPDKGLLTWEEAISNNHVTLNSQLETQLDTNSDSNSDNSFDDQIHKLNKDKTQLAERFSMRSTREQFTTPYTNNDTEYIKDRFPFNDKRIIDPRTFTPKTYEEQQCQKIATALGETDMRFILSCLKKYGFGVIEQTWGNYQETKERGYPIRNPGALFNKMVEKRINQNS